MTLLLEEEVDIPFSFDYRKVAEDVIDKALEVEEFPYEVEVSLVLTDDAAIHELNQQFREMDRSTDVLSFPMMDYPAPGDFSLLGAGKRIRTFPEEGICFFDRTQYAASDGL